jgi:hypothetical protein
MEPRSNPGLPKRGLQQFEEQQESRRTIDHEVRQAIQFGGRFVADYSNENTTGTRTKSVLPQSSEGWYITAVISCKKHIIVALCKGQHRLSLVNSRGRVHFQCHAPQFGGKSESIGNHPAVLDCLQLS